MSLNNDTEVANTRAKPQRLEKRYAQLRGDGPNRPMLGVVQTHDLGLKCARDHRTLPRSRSPAQRTQPRASYCLKR
jgi:hypothetical protein